MATSGEMDVGLGGGGSSPLTTKGDLFTFSTVAARLPVGADGQVLSSDSTQATGLKWIAVAGTGTVTSVALADGSTSPIYTISGSPVTTAGTLTFTLGTQTANKVFAGPSSGGAAQPTFRVLVSADIPSLAYLSSVLTSAHIFVGNGSNVATDVAVSGDLTLANTGAFTIANLAVTNAKIANATIDLTAKVTGILPVANGGTNSSTALNNNRVIQSSAGKIVEAAAITASKALVSDANGIPIASVTTTAELAFVSGVTSAIQTQIDSKQSATLTDAHILVGNGSNVATDVAVSGDLTLADTGAFTIANLAVTNAKIANATINLTTKVTGALPLINGGTGTAAASANAAFNALSPLTTKGDLLTFTTVNARIAVGTDGQVLSADSTQSTGLKWVTVTGTGTVTSVALADGSGTPIYAISGSPVTAAGTLTFTLSTQSANTVFAGPTSGGAAQPTFRSVVAADIPTLNQNTTGTASNVTGVVALINGGTGTAAASANAAFNALSPLTTKGDLHTFTTVNARLAVGTDGQVLSADSTQATGLKWITSAASGTVTSVALADGSGTPIFTISGSPVTASGTLTFTLATETANKIFAGPTAGGAAQPTFRSMVNADLPTYTNHGVILGTGAAGFAATSVGATGTVLHGNTGADPSYSAVSLTSDVTGTLPVANGGTGQTSFTDGQLLIGNSSGNTLTKATLSALSDTVITNGNGSITIGGKITYTVQSGNYTLVAGDRGSFQDMTGASNATYTLTAPGTLGAGWYAWVRNGSATNGVTLTLSPASGNIDGVASYVTYPGDTRLITTDGTNFFSELIAGGYVEFTAAGANTFSLPKQITWVRTELWGAGGGGASGKRGSNTLARAGGGGGGGGAYVAAMQRPSDLSASNTVTLGTGGTGGAAQTSNATNGIDGTAGGNTTFGTLLTAYGGGAGKGGAAVNNAGGGGGGTLGAGPIGVSGGNGTGGAPAIATAAVGHFGGGGGTSGGIGSPAGWGGGAGGGSSVTAAAGDGGCSSQGGSGGGAGGGLTSGNVAENGGVGGSNVGNSAGGGAFGAAGTSGVAGGGGTNGTAGPTAAGPGTAGGGGGAGFDNTGGGTASVGGAGGVGGVACGGGGGGASLSGSNSGAGGNGGNGYARIWYG